CRDNRWGKAGARPSPPEAGVRTRQPDDESTAADSSDGSDGRAACWGGPRAPSAPRGGAGAYARREACRMTEEGGEAPLRGGPAFEGPLALGAEPLELRRVQAPPQREPDLTEDGLDLVERLLPEVLGLQKLGLALLDEVGDGPDVRGLEAVVGPDRQLQLVDRPEQVLVQLDGRRLGRYLLLGLEPGREATEEVEVILQDQGRLADRVLRRAAAVGPELEDEPLGPRLLLRRLHLEVDPVNRGEVGVEDKGIDRQPLDVSLVGRLVAAALLNLHFHLERDLALER